MLHQRRRVQARGAPVAPPTPPPPAPQVVEAIFRDLEAVGRLRPRNRAAIGAFVRSPALEPLSTFSPSVRRRALRQLPHGIPSAKSWLAVCQLCPGPGETTTRRGWVSTRSR
jgi:hypothetical protein